MMYGFTAALAAVLLSAPAWSEDKESSAEATFNNLDVNGDGKLTPAETTPDQERASQFVALDTNADGFLSLQEFTASDSKPSKPGAR